MLIGNAVGIPFTTIRKGVTGPDTTAPTLRWAEVGQIARDTIVMLYNERLDETSTPVTTDFSLTGTSETVSSVLVLNRTVYLSLTGDIEYDDTILLDYTAGANPITDTSSNDAADLVNQAVTNNITIQYIVYSNTLITTPASTVYTDGTYEVRKRIIGTNYIIDIGLTPTGFTGIESVDWAQAVLYVGQTAVFRSGVRAGNFVVDGTIDGTGFAGTEDVNWENLTTAAGGGSETTYRDGIRDGAYVIDKALDGTGFAGTEDVNWENLIKYKAI